MFNRILSLVLTGSMILTMAIESSTLANYVSRSSADSFSCAALSFGMANSFGSGGVKKGPFSVVVGDFNGDDKVDMAVANVNGDVSILLGDGMGGFGAAKTGSLGMAAKCPNILRSLNPDHPRRVPNGYFDRTITRHARRTGLEFRNERA